MDDYQNDTCVGKYLKEIYKRRIPKGSKEKEEPLFNRTKSYGGQFHMDFPGLKDKILFGMGGYGGNMILIDVENSRILVVNSLHYNNKKYKYNHKKLLGLLWTDFNFYPSAFKSFVSTNFTTRA